MMRALVANVLFTWTRGLFTARAFGRAHAAHRHGNMTLVYDTYILLDFSDNNESLGRA